MKRSTVLKASVFISLGFVLAQFVLIPRFLEKRQQNQQTRTDGKDAAKYIISKFLGHARTHHVFLLEQSILQKITSTGNIKEYLQEAESLTFGLIRGDAEAERDFMSLCHIEMEDLGFKVTMVMQGGKIFPGHIFLQHDAITLHIVVFLVKAASSLVTVGIGEGQVPATVLLRDDTFMSTARMFHRFQLKELDEVLIPDPLQKFLEELPGSKYIACNYTAAAEFLLHHPSDVSQESRHFQRKARQLIARAKQYLDDLGIPFWLSSGTCLGWMRQCDIITYSKDVDFGIFIQHYKPELVQVFERGGFFLKHVFGKVSDSYELSFQAGDIKLDLFFFYTEEDHMWNGGTHHKTGQKYKYIFPKFNTCWTMFLDIQVKVPCPPEPYIEANYGKNWREPVKYWEWNKSPPNVRENGVWPREEWDDVIQVY